MFDARIAVEERLPFTEEELQELNEFHDRLDADYLARSEIADFVSDISKDMNGCRHRMSWQTMSLEECQAECDSWMAAHARMEEEAGEATNPAKAAEDWYECQSVQPDEWDDLYSDRGW